MDSLAGFVLRLLLVLSVSALPWTQAWAMNQDQPAQSHPCHGEDHGSNKTSDSPAKADNCCKTVHCHCISAMALPATAGLGLVKHSSAWLAWTPIPLHNPAFPPTPPPPRA